MLCWSAGSSNGRRMQPKPSFGVFSNSGLNDAPLDGFAYHHRASSGLQVKRVFGERMRTDVSRETSRLTGMRAAPTSRAGTLRRPRIRIGNPHASPGGGRRGRASRGGRRGRASRGGRQPRGRRPPRSARTGSRRHRPQKAGKQGGRERTLCTIIGACRRRRGGKPQVGRNGDGEESCIARVLFHAQGNDPSQGARRHGSHPAPPSNAYGCFT